MPRLIDQEDFDDAFWLLVSRYGPWAIRTTPAVNRRGPKRRGV